MYQLIATFIINYDDVIYMINEYNIILNQNNKNNDENIKNSINFNKWEFENITFNKNNRDDAKNILSKYNDKKNNNVEKNNDNAMINEKKIKKNINEKKSK